jgi:hypothetical protein
MIPEVTAGTDSGSVVESEEDFTDEVNSAKDALLADNEAEIPEASPMYDGTISSFDLKNAISAFDVNNTDMVQVYKVD